MKRAELLHARRVVVKIGTSLLAPPGGGVHLRRFAELAQEVSAQLDVGREVVMVSSGAVGLGARRLGLEGRPRSIPEKQAAAAVGQIDLCRRFERAFARRGRTIGQILLTHGGGAEGFTPLVIKGSHDVVVRHIRVRTDLNGDKPGSNGSFLYEDSNNVIFDHVSGSWAGTETA